MSLPPANWYVDSQQQTQYRYWNGEAWTADYAPRFLPTEPQQVNWDQEVSSERSLAKNARKAIAAQGVLNIVSGVFGLLTVVSFTYLFLGGGTLPSPEVFSAGWLVILLTVAQVLSLVAFVMLIVFLFWFHKAATIAKRSDIADSRDPVWAILGFFIPIVNFWAPYQVARGLFPREHDGRGIVKKWWACYLTWYLVALLAIVLAFVSIPLALVVFVLPVLALIGYVYYGRRLVQQATVAHAQLHGLE